MNTLNLTQEEINKLTPAMQQYVFFKNKNPDCLILFRMGDFYETFYDDAIQSSQILDITLTSRGTGEKKAPLAGIPYHALSYYLPKLLNANIKVAICEQVEDPKQAKGLVKRDVIRIYTPGTIIENDLLNANESSYIFCIMQKEDFYVVYGDLSIGEVYYAKFDETDLFNLINKYTPKEIILSDSLKLNNELIEKLNKMNSYLSFIDDIFFESFHGTTYIKTFHPDINLKEIKQDFIGPIYALLNYVRKNHFKKADFIKKIIEIEFSKYMKLDYSTIQNLDLINSKNSLYNILNNTKTKMGQRYLKQILLNPLKEKEEIENRLNHVEKYIQNKYELNKIREIFENLSDIERLNMKISYSNPNPKDVLAFKDTIKIILELSKFNDFNIIKENENEIQKLYHFLINAIKDEVPAIMRDGNVIRDGFSKDLDDLRNIRDNSKSVILEIEKKEQQNTNIKNLKIKYNKVFGYFFEISKGNLDKTPNHFIRKQTLVNAERFVTKELEDLEVKILSAHEKIKTIEQELFETIILEIKNHYDLFEKISKQISYIDLITTFSFNANKYNYVRAQIEGNEIILEESRHPVIERLQDNFIHNDIQMKNQEIFIITGPNMSGKSTLIRQTAIIALMSQIGSFVPCKKAKLPIFDNIYTRIGARDDLAKGDSTFMVEMNEVANILRNATNDSLVILDEIGRGTSTFDGVALAWSIIEYLYNRIKCKTMFATHYHILNKMEKEFEYVTNYSMSVMENSNEVIFLRKLKKGGTDKSYGIYVGQLAGLPPIVLSRAKEVLEKIENDDNTIKKLTADELKQMSLNEIFK
ncbi:MAG: DNA mismatch repair protein MutS [Candidatus Nanoarchaeia archaeon]|nr:DNA mismatch repair protein MutS [Candidatus Nanoarchaeia archaeon]